MSPDYYKLHPKSNLFGDNVRYRQAIGYLLYVLTITREDISASANNLGRRNKKPREANWVETEKLIRYIKATKHFKFAIEKKSRFLRHSVIRTAHAINLTENLSLKT